jgi:hypothetical protein
MNTPRNRIRCHARVRCGDLVPHELNARVHPEAQRAALQALYDEVGFARSLLAYELPDGRLKPIDGHLRRDLTPDVEVDVEVLDVNDAEARALLLSIDPLAQLADYDAATLDRLRQMTAAPCDALANLWLSIDAASTATDASLAQARSERPGRDNVPEQFLILVECADEAAQVTLLERFQKEGLKCRALLS